MLCKLGRGCDFLGVDVLLARLAGLHPLFFDDFPVRTGILIHAEIVDRYVTINIDFHFPVLSA